MSHTGRLLLVSVHCEPGSACKLYAGPRISSLCASHCYPNDFFSVLAQHQKDHVTRKQYRSIFHYPQATGRIPPSIDLIQKRIYRVLAEECVGIKCSLGALHCPRDAVWHRNRTDLPTKISIMFLTRSLVPVFINPPICTVSSLLRIARLKLEVIWTTCTHSTLKATPPSERGLRPSPSGFLLSYKECLEKVV